VVFAFFPPEVNSGLMYTGPGSSPMAASAVAWDSLAADLFATAASYQSVLSELDAGWSGPSATAMAGAAAPYVSWMNATASVAAESGAQVKSAAAAYEAAFAMTVPPALVTSNRALLAALVASNIFGQNTPAIEATEAQYLQMWAQDVAAMNGYAASANTAAQVATFDTPPATTNIAATAAPAAGITDGASVLAGLTTLGTEVQTALGSLSTSGPLAGLLGSLQAALTGSQGATLLTQQGPAALQYVLTPAQLLIQLTSSLSQNGGTGLASSGSEELLTTIGNFVDSKMQLVVGGISDQLRTFGSAVSAQMAHASQLGGLSIPPGWSSTAQGLSRAMPMLPPSSVSSPALSGPTPMPTSPLAQGLMGAASGQSPTSITGKMAPVKLFARSPAGG
jgi:PPE-repeat protein